MKAEEDRIVLTAGENKTDELTAGEGGIVVLTDVGNGLVAEEEAAGEDSGVGTVEEDSIYV